MGVQNYASMQSAPYDGSVVLVLAGSRKPRSAYWDSKDQAWKFWHSAKEDCVPDYWTDLPAEPPSDYLPELKTIEDEEKHLKAVAHLAATAPPVAKKAKAKAEEPKPATKAEEAKKPKTGKEK